MAFDPNASFDVLEAPAPRKAPAFDPSATFEVVGAPSKTGDGGGSAASPPTWGNLPQISKIGQAYDRITGHRGREGWMGSNTKPRDSRRERRV